VTELEHILKLHRCLDPYGERDLNPIHFTCILEIKNIIRMSTNPQLNGKRQVPMQAPNVPLMISIQVGDILESLEFILGHSFMCICPFPPNLFVLVINLLHGVP